MPPPPPITTHATVAAAATNPYQSAFPMAQPHAINNVYSPAYYQQYMQYYQQYIYSQYASGGMPMQPPLMPTVDAAASQSGNLSNPKQDNKNTNNNYQAQRQQPNTTTNQEHVTANGTNKSPIKFNLKFNQFSLNKPSLNETDVTVTQHQQQPAATQPPPVRKSRFNSLDNIKNQQRAFDEKTTTDPRVNNPVAVSSVKIEAQTVSSSSQSEIVFDIHKWPVSLKSFCAKVYQHYQSITLVAEDQVTKYLQQRITDAFKVKPNLEVGWETEQIPTVEQIKQVAPLSNAQQQQLKQQANINIKKMNAARAAANEIQIKQQQKPNAFNFNKLNPNANKSGFNSALAISSPSSDKRKKTRSSSSSSSSSSRSRSSSRSNSSTSSKSTANSQKSSSDSSFSSFNLIKKGSANVKTHGGSLFENKFNNKRKLVPFEVSNGTPSKFSKQVSSIHEEAMDQGNGQFVNSYNSFNNNFNWGLKMTKKQRKKQAKLSKRMQQQQQQRLPLINNNNTDKILLSRINSSKVPSLPYVKVNKSKSLFKSSTELEREQFDALEIDKEDLEHKKLWCIGTNQDFEKDYYRLTGPPEPNTIRPLSVLRRSLEYILSKYGRTNNYRYVCDQLKAIRQDLTVQMIRNKFTIQVYESHARIAIENKDRDEFNQCQNQLKTLYKVVSNKESSNLPMSSNNAEFIGYRLVYNILTKSFKDLNEVTKEIKKNFPSDIYLKHLLELKDAWHLNNYVKFFRLYTLSNHLTKCLINMFIERERKNALKIIIKSFRPSIRLESVYEMLAYESLEKCKEDLLSYNLSIQTVSCSSISDGTNNNISSLTPRPNLNSATINNIKGASTTKIQPTSTVFELILDCKSCNIQNL
jgi:hypothetical protein